MAQIGLKKKQYKTKLSISINYREMAERSKAAVLKTVEVKASWGSNPYLPAIVTSLNLRSKISFIAYAERAA